MHNSYIGIVETGDEFHVIPQMNEAISNDVENYSVCS
jgi:hypothetical protein